MKEASFIKRYGWQIMLGTALVTLSSILYFFQYLVFRDTYSILYYMVQDIAFVPFQVFLVTLIIHRFLSEREKRAMLNKLNMVIGAFFSEVGTELLKYFADFNVRPEELNERFGSIGEWPRKKFFRMRRELKKAQYTLESTRGDLEKLRSFLMSRKNFLLRLLENPNMLEHESFTDLLWAVFHMTEELLLRPDLRDLPPSDHDHLSGDIKRAFTLLMVEWLAYLGHLQREYPYLYSLALRTNPFDSESSPVIGTR